MKAKRFLALALAALMTLALAACGGNGNNNSTPGSTGGNDGGNAGGGDAASGITVQINNGNPETLDPAMNSAVDGANMLITFFETLLIVDENLAVVPGQAESYDVSDDGLVWTFTMRDGLKWSDGSDLNAKDFEYSFKRMADPEVAAPYGQTVMGMVEGFDEAMETGDTDKLNVVASEDGKTLTITLSYPCAYFDKLAAFATLSPVNRATIEANGDAWATAPETYVCNGPYMISEWVPGERVVATKNPYYSGGWDTSRIVSDSITFLLLEDASACFAAYNSGEAQFIKEVPPDEIPSLTKAEDGGDFYIDPMLGTYYISMNLNDPVFQDVNVRKALSLAIDREYLADVVMQGVYFPAYNFVGPGVDDAGAPGGFEANTIASNGGKPFIPTDYEEAKKLAQEALAEAGYPNGEGFPGFEYSTNVASFHLPIAEYLQSVYKEVLNIDMTINRMEWASFTPARRAGDYQMARNGWVMDYNDASNLVELLQSTNGNNDGKYNNPAFDAAMAASQVADSAEHFKNLHAAEKIMMEDYACIPAAYYADYWLQDASLKGTWHSPYGYWYFQYGYIG